MGSENGLIALMKHLKVREVDNGVEKGLHFGLECGDTNKCKLKSRGNKH